MSQQAWSDLRPPRHENGTANNSSKNDKLSIKNLTRDTNSLNLEEDISNLKNGGPNAEGDAVCCVHFYHRKGSGDGEAINLRNSPSEIEKLDAIASVEMTDLLIEEKERASGQPGSAARLAPLLDSSSEMKEAPEQVKFTRNVSQVNLLQEFDGKGSKNSTAHRNFLREHELDSNNSYTYPEEANEHMA